MSLNSFCNTCNKSVSYGNYIKCNLCLIQTKFKCNNLNFADSQIIQKTKNHSFVSNALRSYFRLLV